MEKLFELDSGERLLPPAPAEKGPRAGTTTICVTPQIERCVPMKVRMSAEVAERFEVLEINAGVERLLAYAHAPASGSGLGRPDALLPVVMVRGMDYSMVARNISDRPARFQCEVWGSPTVPDAAWKTSLLGGYEEADSPLFAMTCGRCDHTYVLKAGDYIPRWCGLCIDNDWCGRRAQAAG